MPLKGETTRNKKKWRKNGKNRKRKRNCCGDLNKRKNGKAKEICVARLVVDMYVVLCETK